MSDGVRGGAFNSPYSIAELFWPYLAKNEIGNSFCRFFCCLFNIFLFHRSFGYRVRLLAIGKEESLYPRLPLVEPVF